MKIITYIGILALLLPLPLGCDNGMGGTGVSNPPFADTIFYDAVQEVTPSFAPEGASSSLTQAAVVTAWGNGNPLYELFYILQDFDPAEDQGVIDTANLYKTMYEARVFLSNTKSNCSALREQVIAPPFDFWDDDTTYNCAYNEDAADGRDFGGAVKELDADGNIIDTADTTTEAVVQYGLAGFVWIDDEDNHYEYGVFQGVHDSSTSDLELDIAIWVDYPGSDDYCYRNDIDGNASTHLFTFKSIKGNIASGSAYTSIVGHGISQGAGNYFLVKITTGDLNGKYYCIGAEDGEAALKAMDVNGSDAISEDSGCYDYIDEVTVLVPFTTDDLACESSDFNPGGIGTAAEGTVFLNFQ